jgi:hypothetical protein
MLCFSQRKAGVHARVLGIHLAGIRRLAAVAPAFRVKRRPGRSTCPFQCPAASAGRLLAHDLDAVELRRRSFAVAVQGRCGRGLPPPSGRMRACAADAPGRHLGCWIMKCCYGQGCRMRAVSSRRAAMRMIRAALAPEKFVSRSPPLLQSASIEPFSAPVLAPHKRRFGHGSRAELDTARAERGRTALSGGRFLSGAWDLADPVYKVGSEENGRFPASGCGAGWCLQPLTSATRNPQRPLVGRSGPPAPRDKTAPRYRRASELIGGLRAAGGRPTRLGSRAYVALPSLRGNRRDRTVRGGRSDHRPGRRPT